MELLSPAGSPEKLRAAVRFGADAVYLACERFGMRAAAGSFAESDIAEAVAYAHSHGVKVFAAVNIMPRTRDYGALAGHIAYLRDAGADAVIVSDLGVLELVKKVAPHLAVHVSTQASVRSAPAALAYMRLGAQRIVLARECSLDEIAEIRANTPRELELEVFCHGSMCVAYSGRCILSNALAGAERDANAGRCTQPCRWNYTAVELTEEKRPNEPFTAEQHNGETFFMASRDMCLIDRLRDLRDAGLDSLKIEGRMRSPYYAAVVTNAYRIALDALERGEEVPPELHGELDTVSHREYSTGFFYDAPERVPNIVTQPGYIRERAYLAVAVADSAPGGLARFVQRGKFLRGDTVELLSPGMTGRAFVAEELYGADGEPIEDTRHAAMMFALRTPYAVAEGDMLRSAGSLI